MVATRQVCFRPGSFPGKSYGVSSWSRHFEPYARTDPCPLGVAAAFNPAANLPGNRRGKPAAERKHSPTRLGALRAYPWPPDLNQPMLDQAARRQPRAPGSSETCPTALAAAFGDGSLRMSWACPSSAWNVFPGQGPGEIQGRRARAKAGRTPFPLQRFGGPIEENEILSRRGDGGAGDGIFKRTSRRVLFMRATPHGTNDVGRNPGGSLEDRVASADISSRVPFDATSKKASPSPPPAAVGFCAGNAAAQRDRQRLAMRYTL